MKKKGPREKKAANVDFFSCCIFCVDFLQFCCTRVINKVVLRFITYSALDPDVQYERYAHDMFCVAQFMTKVLWKRF